MATAATVTIQVRVTVERTDIRSDGTRAVKDKRSAVVTAGTPDALGHLGDDVGWAARDMTDRSLEVD